jgi:hypothetical protein
VTGASSIARDVTSAIQAREQIAFEEEGPELSPRVRAQTGRPGDTEAEVHDKQGRVFPVYVRHRGVSLGVRGSASSGLISVAIDITARRDAEQAIRRRVSGSRARSVR